MSSESSHSKNAKRFKSKRSLIKLGLEDSQAFVESLLNSPEPNPRMMTAAAEYKRSLNR